ncbi:MAG TPA: DNA-formamidopyrimidine glycosylase family protein [Longimicrobiales bacterium]
MPELPEITVYLDALERRILGRPLERVRLRSPSLLRSYDPPLSAVEGRRVLGLRRIGKRIVWQLEDDLFLVLHLMIAGRLRWKKKGAPVPKKGAHAAFDFPDGTLLLTEAATHKRARLHVVRGEEALAALDPGGLEPLDADPDAFRAALTRENHTLKRALTDPRLLSGIGNAHSDEILLDARLSPLKRTHQLNDDELRRLYDATRASLAAWIERLRAETGDAFPEKVTAFHPAMKVHGRFRQPCPNCGTAIQRIVHGEHEVNYCPRCQTGGRLMRDRALSKLLREDWPATIDEWEGR